MAMSLCPFKYYFHGGDKLLYRFEEGNMVGFCRFKEAVIAFYDMGHKGDCFDESRTDDVDIPLRQLLSYVETEEDIEKNDRSRVFIYMDDGKEYELIMNPINTPCRNFYDRGNTKFEKESFTLIQDILEEAGELEKRVDYETLVTTECSE